ncbi:Crp/Fnr family transcriptional regulator [Amaricoccus sp.]|uniref:Crp/Fnr family transcriptional regulator n=1 Tax=Amaricoccus sp. TaxID=1872485 RepID=UPI0026133288|nr:Crp/Fnr family transcriptional regulator [Amaricoccus sp.]HRO10414.1 Crp/Fnr family transcriptional regulator [Amaricoccus sp.]
MPRRDPIPCEICPLRARPVFRALTREELAFMHGFKRGELVVDAGATILMEDSASPHLYTILEGWAFRHKQIEDGRRQVLNFALPGDLVGLQLAIMNEMQHTVTALTRARLCVFQRDKVWSVFRDHASLGFAMTWSAAREEQLLDGHLLSVGQRNAIERVAYLILHLYDRAEAVGYAGNDALRAPFTQAHFADALGITTVHLSRTLRRLREQEVVRWSEDAIVILARRELERIGSYERVEGPCRPLI